MRDQVRGCSLATRSSSLTDCRCCCYITQWRALPEGYSLLCSAPRSTEVVRCGPCARCQALCPGWYCSWTRASQSTQGNVYQVAARISWHREPSPHMAECSGCCRNHLRYRSSGGYQDSSANTEDPHGRLVQHFEWIVLTTCCKAIRLHREKWSLCM